MLHSHYNNVWFSLDKKSIIIEHEGTVYTKELDEEPDYLTIKDMPLKRLNFPYDTRSDLSIEVSKEGMPGDGEILLLNVEIDRNLRREYNLLISN